MVCNILKISITDFDYHNGRLCFECDQQLSPDNCDQVTLCDQDRVSLSNTNIIVGTKLWHIMPVLSFIMNTVYLPTIYLDAMFWVFFNLIISYLSLEILFYYHDKYYYHYYNDYLVYPLILISFDIDQVEQIKILQCTTKIPFKIIERQIKIYNIHNYNTTGMQESTIFFLLVIKSTTVKQQLHSLSDCLAIIWHGPILRHDR